MGMHNKRKTLLKLLLLSFLMISCVTPMGSADDPENPDNPGNPDNPNSVIELIPLAVGNQWSYRLFTPTPEEEHQYLIADVAPFTIGKSIYPTYRMTGPTTGYNGMFSLFMDYTTWGFFNNDSGFNKLEVLSSLEKISSLWFKYPCNVGDTYGNYSVGSLNYTITNDYLGTSFNCIQYIYTYENYQHEYYVYPGVGIIRAYFYNQALTFELTGYTIN